MQTKAKNDMGLLTGVANYYADKLAKFGETPLGVDWNGEASQILRFNQLSKVLPTSGSFTLNDLGCGYGALLDFLQKKHVSFTYTGIDVSSEMTRSARYRHLNSSNARFITSSQPDQMSDYGVASGIFNVRLGHSDIEWYGHLKNTLDILNHTSKLGFSFNCLTSYSDQEKKRDYLYYADPCLLFDLCKRHYSGEIALLHDYGLYEFTILVRKVL